MSKTHSSKLWLTRVMSEIIIRDPQVVSAEPEKIVDIETAALAKKVTQELTAGGPPRNERERIGDAEIAEAKRFSQEMMGQNGPYFKEHPTLAKIYDIRSGKEVPTTLPTDWEPTPWEKLEESLLPYNDEFWKTYIEEERTTLEEQQNNFSSPEDARRILFPTVLRHTEKQLIAEREIKKLEENIYSDALTGLKNKAYLQEKAPEKYDEYQNAGQSVALFNVDVDRFKEINDTLGHEAGDGVLQTIADLLLNGVRPDDIVIRPGGDEFTILLGGMPVDQAVAVAERLRHSGHAQGLKLAAEGADIPFSFSIGVSVSAPGDGKTFGQLQSEADIAMYQSKQNRNKSTLFLEGMTMPPPNSTRKH